ncbi:unnamed protein product, partial [Tetraodon nigroviridis]
TDAESHNRDTPATSHECARFIMEELEHTCPHPRTVGHVESLRDLACVRVQTNIM